jgi:alpha-soluble NSF attachment protein
MSAMAKKQKQKAEDYMSEADKLLNKKSWFSSGRERNTEDAAELFMQAANAYKVGGFNQEAGDTYMKAGDLHRDKLSNNNEAAKCFSQAGTTSENTGNHQCSCGAGTFRVVPSQYDTRSRVLY